MQELLRKVNESRKKHRNLNIVLSVLAVLVVGGVLWKLTLPGITMTTDKVYCGKEDHTHTEECEASRKLICGKDEAEGHTHGDGCYTEKSELVCSQKETGGHTHGDNCYTEHSKLVCGLVEDEDHTHGADCYETVRELTCGKEEMTGHTHGADCYKTVKELTCGKKEAEEHKHNDNCYESKSECGKEEHVHTLECYSDVKADVEDSAKWKKMFKDVKLGDDWGENVLTIAKTQIGYQESKKNYEVAEDGTTLKGYTRYGAWSGKNYIDWDSAFASFVLNYAQVPEKGFPTKPEDMDTVKWMNKLSESKLLGGTDAQPEVGDLVFFKRKVNNAEKNFVGIISKIEKDTDEKITYIKVIEGNYRFEEKDIVKENRYAYTDSSIQAYGLLSVAEKNYKGTDEVEKKETTEAAKEQAADEKTTKRQIFKTARNAEKATADETLQSGSRDAANDTVQSRATAELPVIAITGSGTTYDPATGKYKSDVGIDFKFTNKNDVQSENDYTFTYPKEILVPGGLIGVEKVLLDNGKEAGTYTFEKNADGTHTVKIKFYDSYIQEAGDTITGNLTFGGTLDKAAGEDGKIKIPVGKDNLELVITPDKIEYKGDETDRYNIDISKSGSYVAEDDKLVYTVYVRSTKGTPDPIDFEDTITANGLNLGTPTVTVEKGTYEHHNDNDNRDKNDWQPQTVTNPIYENGNISMQLPKLEAGEKIVTEWGSYTLANCYKITYTYDLSGQSIEQTSANNEAIVKAEDKKSHQIVTDKDDFPVKIDKKQTLKKEGSYDYTTGRIKWTITVNDNHVNIAGAELTDQMLGEISKGTEISADPKEGCEVQKDSSGNVTGIKFKKLDGKQTNHNKYVITYYTDAEQEWDDKVVTNTVNFDPTPGNPGDEKTVTGKAEVKGSGVVKECKGMTTTDKQTGEITWTVTIDVPKEGSPKPTIIKDPISCNKNDASKNQWMTWNQINSWASNMYWASGGGTNAYCPPANLIRFTASDGKVYTYQEIIQNSGGKFQSLTYTNLEIEFPEGLKSSTGKSDKLYFTFKTTVDLTKANIDTTQYYNEVKVNDKNADAHYDYYKAGVVKTDGNEKTGTTQISNTNGSLTWKVKVALDGVDKKKLTVTDTLPDGVLLKRIYVAGAASMTLTIDEAGNISGQDNNTRVSGTYNTTTGEITIDVVPLRENETLYKNNRYIFQFDCQVDVDKMEPGKTYPFTNQVSVSSDQGDLGSSSQTQEWTYNKQTEGTKVLNKIGHWDNDNRQVDYSILINPEGKDLVPDTDVLTLYDVLGYNSKLHVNDNKYEAEMKISLLHDSVRLYKAVKDENGKYVEGERLMDWSWIYESYPTNNDEYNVPITNKITATKIPDSTPLIMKYSYSVSSTIHKGDEVYLGGINNNAYLEGTSYQDGDGRGEDKWEDQESSGSVTTEKSYKFYKVEQGNYNKILPGAKFSVYKYNPNSGKCDISVKNDIVTDEKGMFSIKWKDGGYDYNTLYKVMETEAPEGYLLPDPVKEYYFYFSNAEDTEHQLPGNLPTSAADLSKEERTEYVENSENRASIEVEKKWFDSESTDITENKKKGSITFDLYQKVNYEKPESPAEPVVEARTVKVNCLFGQYDAKADDNTLLSKKNKTIICKVGTVIEFSITSTDPYANAPYAQVSVDKYGNYQYVNYCRKEGSTYYFNYTVGQELKEVNIKGIVNHYNLDTTSIGEITVTPPSGEVIDSNPKVGTFTISASDNWIWSSDDVKDLKLPQIGTDKDGKTVYYTYYVRENPDDAFEYVNNNTGTGIPSGTITIKNTSTTTEPEEYELPETGGPGTIPYTTAGLSIMLMAGFMYTLKSRKGGRRFFRN